MTAQDDEETKDEPPSKSMSRKDNLVAQMRQKLTKEEEDFKVANIYEIRRRVCSLDTPLRKGRLYTKYRLLEEPDNWDNKV